AGLQACSCASIMCCSGCGSHKHARSLHVLILLLTAVTAAAFLSPAIGAQLEHMAKFTGPITGCNATLCAQEWSRLGTHRVLFASFLLSAIMCVLMIGVKTLRDCRIGLHAGAWGFKIVLLILFAVAAFWVPNSFFDTQWPVLVQTGSLLFSGAQAMILVRMAHSMAYRLDSATEDGSKLSRVAVMVITVGAGLATVVGSVYLFKLHGPDEGPCVERGGPPRWIVATVNLVLVCAAVGMSVLSCVRKRLSYAGLLQASIISLQMTNLAWLSLRIDSTADCEPTKAAVAGTVVGCLLLLATLWYSCTRMRTQTNFVMLQDDYDDSAWSRTDTGHSFDPKMTHLSYDASFFHLVVALSAMRITTLLADMVPSASLTVRETAYANWAQAASSWLTWAVYAWSLVVPSCTTGDAI
ncbi:MAG: hypothetical protein EBZ60_09020, partial [Betaproteobacteria bacterium]|nr:hypothetical protein [Betaproteobacteria bacterium]